MKREEKNQQTKRRIMDSALTEFSKQGYGASSVNTICASQGLSKGIIYHYFRTKDELYLACVEECFLLLTQHLEFCAAESQNSTEDRLEKYFSARMDFFHKNPVYQPIFCEVIISPPVHLKDQIQERKQIFDTLNKTILERLLQPLPLRSNITIDEVVETFRLYQDFINARYPVSHMSASEFEMRDESCRKALNILLYGVIDRKENSYV